MKRFLSNTRISLKVKLIIGFIAVVIITSLVTALVGVKIIGNGIIREEQDRVRTDLYSAREIYQGELKEMKDLVRLTAERFFIKEAILESDMEIMEEELVRIREEENLDVLTCTDKDGVVLFRAGNTAVHGDSQAEDDLISSVLLNMEPAASTQIIPSEELEKEGEDLVQKAYIEFIPTPNEKERPEKEETSGMVLMSAAPVMGYDNELLGVIYAWRLLNRNYEIVDKVKDTVYEGVKYKGKDIGTATIFLEDLRVSTNVQNLDGSRAIGTRVSEEVYNRVLVDGMPWIGRAFVVNDWYISAYEPIKNINEETIGILYVGLLEEKFTDLQNSTVGIFLGITLSGMILSLIVSYFLISGILKPVSRLVYASKQLAKGDLTHRVESATKDEIGELADSFNLMASSIKERDDRLKASAQQKIQESERLASIGRLAAGIAHEINNPLGAVLVYSNLLLEESKLKGPEEESLRKIVRETIRCKEIVKGLLDFARKTKPKKEPAYISSILDSVISLVEKQSLFQNISITRKFNGCMPMVMVDKSQIQQVFLNIILNAAEAMQGKGNLTVSIKLLKRGKFIEIIFADTGCGIPRDDMQKLFEPFFTTKEQSSGIGLGLAISYGIIKNHGGNIEVNSRVGKGTEFYIRLPVERNNKKKKEGI
jgi:two-component system NtrC family sensor kinase